MLAEMGKSAWWHNVEALEPVNFSINFWWCEPAEWVAEPFGALVHSLLALRSLIKKMPTDLSVKILQALFPDSPRE